VEDGRRRWLRITPYGVPRSVSSALKTRPASGATPSVAKKPESATMPFRRPGSPWPLSVIGTIGATGRRRVRALAAPQTRRTSPRRIRHGRRPGRATGEGDTRASGPPRREAALSGELDELGPTRRRAPLTRPLPDCSGRSTSRRS
jgi:hypothetical protein